MVKHNNCYNKIIPGHQCPQQEGQKQESEYNFSVVVGYSHCKISFMANQEKRKGKDNGKNKNQRDVYQIYSLLSVNLHTFL
jgi:hypothetical protein